MVGSSSTTTRGGFARCEQGFTLVELSAVVLILGVMSAVALPSLRGLDGARQNIAATRIRNVLVYAQEQAMSSNTDTWAVVNSASDTVVLYREDPSNPGSAGRVRMTDPLTRRALTLSVADAGGDISAVDLGGTTEVQFDQLGIPYNSFGRPFAADGTISVSGGSVVRVTQGTGLITVD